MMLVIHWGNGGKSIFNGFSWEVNSSKETLKLYNSAGGTWGSIPLKDIHEPTYTATVYHVWTDATEWSRTHCYDY